MTLTAIIPVYQNNTASQFSEAVKSVYQQTLLPDEILVVADGPVPPDVEAVIEIVKSKVVNDKIHIEVNYLEIEENVGLGEAMRQAVLLAKGDYIARMDADDICLPDRFERQMKCFEEDPDLSIVGGQISEFDRVISNISGRRVVPLEHDKIARFMKSRNGMNHMTVIIKKKDLIDAGNYQPFFLLEDYYLWVRMLQHGCKFRNIGDDVVLVSAGKELMDRRGGYEYFLRQCQVFKYMLDTGFISYWRYTLNLTERGIVHVLMPVPIRSLFYRLFLRN